MSPQGYQPAPWEESAPRNQPQPVAKQPSAPTQYPAQYQQQPARRGVGRTRMIIGITVAVLLFVVGPITFQVLRMIGESERETAETETKNAIADQRDEVSPLLDRARAYLRDQYARSGDDLGTTMEFDKQCKAGTFASENYQIVGAKVISSVKSPNAMNVELKCVPKPSAADPHSTCTMVFNWDSGVSQTAWQ